ncbi:hypothetical protein L2E82_12725 [Cichorium intybus]|uniref:Uncharacterized protein n=1 Tax=Cichorium intybus TaxID=13427 RepID=A0ACB9GH04_CICIN|nr:hypothetical protein L2E82_12725 [Cichorium intybus]
MIIAFSLDVVDVILSILLILFHSHEEGLTYKEAGVDIDAGLELVRRIAKMAPGIGGFGGLFPLGDSYLVAGTDGVGTKLKLAFETGILDIIGIDLVAMSVNNIITSGAKPLLFLDYYATSQLDVDLPEKVIKGIVDSCQQSDCALLGGETAEMPDFYAKGEYDLSGFAVGIVKRSLVLARSGLSLKDKLPGESVTLAEALMAPTLMLTDLSLGWGVAVLVGVPHKNAIFKTSPLNLLNERTLKGTFFGNYKPRSDIPSVVEKYMNKELELEKFITHEVPFSEINKAFHLMLKGEGLRSLSPVQAERAQALAADQERRTHALQTKGYELEEGFLNFGIPIFASVGGQYGGTSMKPCPHSYLLGKTLEVTVGDYVDQYLQVLEKLVSFKLKQGLEIAMCSSADRNASLQTKKQKDCG